MGNVANFWRAFKKEEGESRRKGRGNVNKGGKRNIPHEEQLCNLPVWWEELQ